VHLKADGAVMITGSHNPSEFNGFKTVCGSVRSTAKTFRKVRRIIETGAFAKGQGSRREVDLSTTTSTP